MFLSSLLYLLPVNAVPRNLKRTQFELMIKVIYFMDSSPLSHCPRRDRGCLGWPVRCRAEWIKRETNSIPFYCRERQFYYRKNHTLTQERSLKQKINKNTINCEVKHKCTKA